MNRWFAVGAVLLLPACGGDGAGSPAFAPSADVVTPVGVRHSRVEIEFSLTDPSGTPVDVGVSFSVDGGANFLPATAAFGSAPLSGLATSSAGADHTFLWDSTVDGVATGTVAYGGGITSVGTVNPQVRVRVSPAGGTADTTASFSVDNTMGRPNGATTTAIFPHTLAAQGTSETATGDLIADAIRARYGTQLAIQNGWGIRQSLPSAGFLPPDTLLRRPAGGYAAGPPYDLTVGDFFDAMPFGNRVVVRTVTGAQLHAALENGVGPHPANSNGFPQISGFSFSFQGGVAAGNRVISVTLDGGAPILEDATVYTLALNDFLNAGGDGYSMFNDGQGTMWEVMAQVVADYAAAAGPLTPSIAGRITVVP